MYSLSRLVGVQSLRPLLTTTHRAALLHTARHLQAAASGSTQGKVEDAAKSSFGKYKQYVPLIVIDRSEDLQKQINQVVDQLNDALKQMNDKTNAVAFSAAGYSLVTMLMVGAFIFVAGLFPPVAKLHVIVAEADARRAAEAAQRRRAGQVDDATKTAAALGSQ